MGFFVSTNSNGSALMKKSSTRPERTTFRLTPTERHLLEAVAEAEEMKLSATIRSLLIPAARSRLRRLEEGENAGK